MIFDQLMECISGSLLIVLITGIAVGTVFNIQVPTTDKLGVQEIEVY